MQEFSESEWIFRAMSFILLVFFVGIPIFMFAESEPQAIYFVFCAIIFVVCCSLLGFIFVPKIINRNSRVSIASSVKRLKKKEAEGSQKQYNNNISEVSQTTASSAGEGPKILQHPKLMQEELDTLRAKNAMLEVQLKENPRVSSFISESYRNEISESHNDGLDESTK